MPIRDNPEADPHGATLASVASGGATRCAGQPYTCDDLGVEEVRSYNRAVDGRLVAGVCRGLATHLRLDPFMVRVAFCLLSFAAGVGVLAYLAFWVTVPVSGENSASPAAPARDWPRLLAFGSFVLGGFLVLSLLGWLPALAAWPVVLVGLGAALVWQQADEAEREHWRTGQRLLGGGRRLWPRLLLGSALVLIGLEGFVISQGDLDATGTQLLSTAVAVVGIAVVFAPWWLHMARELAAERRERIRSQERAEVAAHVHDSVLHTLTLIQRGADDPHEVRRLARVQERELRTWLYRGRGDETRTLAAAVEHLAAEVEEAYGVPIEVVPVGDCELDERLGAALQAAREALVNAAKYAGPGPISLFVEVEPQQVTIFVRDRGDGFDVDAIPDDRLGVRESIIGRMSRNGGTGRVRSAAGQGTEVELEVPR